MKTLEDNKTLHKILKYYFIDDITQQEIAYKLNISRIKVIRYINYAREHRLVEVKLNISLKDSFNLESQIESTFKIKECRIIPSFSANNEIYKYAGIELVDLLKRLLKKDMYVGVTWSQALKNTIEYINPGKRIIINVVPMIGGLELNGMTTNSNIIAHIFAEKMGGINYTVSIPAVFDSKKAKEIIEKERHTKKIKEIADKIELAITGVGDMGFDGTAFKSGYFTHDERSYLESLGIVAIVNLNFINAKGEEVKTEIDDRIIKIFPLEKFKSLNDVIGIAFGENKVIPLKAALSGKIIKYLITDENTANKLLG